jgi:putative ABC transport system permease protein
MYFLPAIRTIAREPRFAAIKIGGIALGIAACLFILAFVRHETSYDSWLAHSDRIFRVEGTLQFPGQPPIQVADSPGVALPMLDKDLSQVEAGVRLLPALLAVRQGDQWLNQEAVFADPSLLQVLELPLVAGDAAAAFARPDAALVTEATAERLFGRENALGKTVEVGVNGGARVYRIGGVLADLPANTNLELGLVLPLQVADFAARPGLFDDWSSFGVATFVRLRSAQDAAFVAAQLQPILGRYGDTGAPGPKMSDMFRLRLVNIEDIHLQTPAAVGGFKPAGDATLNAVLIIVALLTFLVATLNHVNLSVAAMARRANEVGVRKTFGASRSQIALQFLAESLLVAAVGGMLGLALFELLLPSFNGLFGLSLRTRDFGALPAVAAAAMILAAGIGGGAYPAAAISGLRPRNVLGGSGTRGPQGSEAARAVLVTLQFTVATALIICVAIMFAQIGHLKRLDLGYQPGGLLVVSGIDRPGVVDRQEALLRAVAVLPGVAGVTRSAFTPATEGQTSQNVVLPGVPEDQAPTINAEPVDWDFARVYGARLVAGRLLRREVAGDDATGLDPAALAARGHNIVVNATAARVLGFRDLHEAAGKDIRLGGDAGDYPVTIVGVVDDLRTRSARVPVAPSYYYRDEARLGQMTVRFQGTAPGEVQEAVRGVWERFAGTAPFESAFVDEAIAELYEAEVRQGTVLALFSGIAVLLSCLGLYGLTIFAAERRTKEIGIRKVLGARNRDIITLLAWKACRPVLLANLIAWPIAAWLMLIWLNGFSERIALNPMWFVLAGLGTLTIAFVTVAGHAGRVARRSPIHALRYE